MNSCAWTYRSRLLDSQFCFTFSLLLSPQSACLGLNLSKSHALPLRENYCKRVWKGQKSSSQSEAGPSSCCSVAGGCARLFDAALDSHWTPPGRPAPQRCGLDVSPSDSSHFALQHWLFSLGPRTSLKLLGTDPQTELHTMSSLSLNPPLFP